MALYMDDFKVSKSDGWVNIPLKSGGTFVYIVGIDGGDVIVKTGNSVNSEGAILHESDQFKSPEDIQVRAVSYCRITVIRDGV